MPAKCFRRRSFHQPDNQPEEAIEIRHEISYPQVRLVCEHNKNK